MRGQSAVAGRSGPCLGRRLERVTALVPGTTAVDRRSIDTIHPSARADQQAPLPMFRCPGLPGVP